MPLRPQPTHPNMFISTSLALTLYGCATTFNSFHVGSGIHTCIFVLARKELSQLSYLCRFWVCLIEKEKRKVYSRKQKTTTYSITVRKQICSQFPWSPSFSQEQHFRNVNLMSYQLCKTLIKDLFPVIFI